MVKIRLREVRERRLMTQEELAAKSGVSQTSISSIELGKSDARVSTARRLAEALGVDPEVLLADDPVRRKEGDSSNGD